MAGEWFLLRTKTDWVPYICDRVTYLAIFSSREAAAEYGALWDQGHLGIEVDSVDLERARQWASIENAAPFSHDERSFERFWLNPPYGPHDQMWRVARVLEESLSTRDSK